MTLAMSMDPAVENSVEKVTDYWVPCTSDADCTNPCGDTMTPLCAARASDGEMYCHCAAADGAM